MARALVGDPAILLCDEPTGNLDPQQSTELLSHLDAAHDRGATLLVATHDPGVVDFGAARGWRRARLVDGELLDVDLPVARPARLDEDTEGFGTRERPDATDVVRLKPRVAEVA
jgi:ABC-type multidrug transport system ATPase subunit